MQELGVAEVVRSNLLPESRLESGGEELVELLGADALVHGPRLLQVRQGFGRKVIGDGVRIQVLRNSFRLRLQQCPGAVEICHGLSK